MSRFKRKEAAVKAASSSKRSFFVDLDGESSQPSSTRSSTGGGGISEYFLRNCRKTGQVNLSNRGIAEGTYLDIGRIFRDNCKIELELDWNSIQKFGISAIWLKNFVKRHGRKFSVWIFLDLLIVSKFRVFLIVLPTKRLRAHF